MSKAKIDNTIDPFVHLHHGQFIAILRKQSGHKCTVCIGSDRWNKLTKSKAISVDMKIKILLKCRAIIKQLSDQIKEF